jgi:hypothetical protein
VVSLLLAAAAIVAGVVAWPSIQSALRRTDRPAKKRQVAVAAATSEEALRKVDAAPPAAQPGKQEPPAAITPAAPPASRPAPPDPEPPSAADPTPAPAPPAPTSTADATPAPPPVPVAVESTPAMREGERAEEADEKDAAQAAGEVARAIATAAAAVRRHDHAAAEQALEVADGAAAGDADLETRVNRWRLLVGYAGQLDGHLARAVASANEGREYTIGERTISIVELGPETFAYKEAGKVTRGPRGEFPRVVERAILAAWFDGDPRPANAIFVGLHRLLDDEPDLDRVRQAWQEAAAGDAAAASILPLLDDPAIAAGR